MWGKRAAATPPPPLPPPPPRDAFAALMRAAAEPAADAASLGRGSGRGGGRGSTRGRGGGKGAEGKGGKGGGRGGGSRRLQPFKRIEGTPFVVDGFTCGASPGDLHFLTHFHSDHYIGITKRWSEPIYASPITAALVVRRLGVRAEQVVVLPMDVPTEINGAFITPIDANHCPGAVLLLFELSNGRSVLHTGDFRYEPSMLLHPAPCRHAYTHTHMHACMHTGTSRRCSSTQRSSDGPMESTPSTSTRALHPSLPSAPTAPGRLRCHPLCAVLSRAKHRLASVRRTYCEPQHTFPTQEAVIRSIIDRCRLLVDAERTLVLFGAYAIGKEVRVRVRVRPRVSPL